MSEFSLRALITKVRKESSSIHPGELTQKVLAEIEPEQQLAALEQALRVVVSNSITSADRPFLRPAPRNTAKSWKTEASRNRYRHYLEEPFHVVPGVDSWIAFGDCTAEDLAQGSAHRHAIAAANIAAADVLDGWIELLNEHGVERVRDLPDGVLRERFNGSAAA